MDLEMVRLISRVCAFCEEEGHAIMDYPFVPFHIKENILRHVELQNVAKVLMDQTQAHELKQFIVYNKLRGMELGSQLGPQSRQIHSSIQIRSRKPKVYSHPHSTPQKIPLGNHRLEHRQIRINKTSPIMSKATIVET
jgi:hypothetical protein